MMHNGVGSSNREMEGISSSLLENGCQEEDGHVMGACHLENVALYEERHSSSGSTETLCPTHSTSLQVAPSSSSLVGKAESVPSPLTPAIKLDSLLHRPASHARSRQHNVAFADNRSETSSEQMKASKFKVVKLESKAPYFRGRWQCFDFHDRMKDSSKSLAAADKVSSSVDQSTASNAAGTVPALIANTVNGVATNNGGTATTAGITADIALPDASVVAAVIPSKFKVTAVQLAPNMPALTAPSHSLAKPLSELKPEEVLVQRIEEELETAVIRPSPDEGDSGTVATVSQQSSAQSAPRTLQQASHFAILSISQSNAALSAELSRRTTIDMTGAGSEERAGVSLDKKIRQCMDLVGNHLIIAVREELSQVTGELAKLKEKLEELEFENNALRSENIILRSAAADLPSRNQPSRRK